MSKSTKQVVVIAIAVVVGIWLYRMLSKGGKSSAVKGPTDALYEGPDVDSRTGAYLPPGGRPGTVETSPMGN